MVSTAARFVLLCGALPALLNYVVYYGYASAIMGPYLHPETFEAIFSQGVFKYRVLGPALLRLTHELVITLGLPVNFPGLARSVDPAISETFYSAYFYLNTVFLCASAAALFYLFRSHAPDKPEAAHDGAVLLCVLLMVLTQYMIVPYDMLSVFLMVVAFHLAERPASATRFVALSMVLALAALTRETAALVLSYFATRHLPSLWRGPGALTAALRLGGLVGVFLAVYVGLRVWFGPGEMFFENFRLAYNFRDQFSLVGGTFFAASALLAVAYRPARSQTVLFLAATAPYWVAMFLIANPREIRLWVPVLVGFIVLQVLPSPQAADRANSYS